MDHAKIVNDIDDQIKKLHTYRAQVVDNYNKLSGENNTQKDRYILLDDAVRDIQQGNKGHIQSILIGIVGAFLTLLVATFYPIGGVVVFVLVAMYLFFNLYNVKNKVKQLKDYAYR